MKYIGEHISINELEGATEIKIVSPLEPWMKNAMLAWLVLWTSLGVYVTYYLTNTPLESNQRIFFLTYLSFWLWFEYKTAYAYLFKKYGYEWIRIDADDLYFGRKLFGLGKIRKFMIKNIQKLDLVEFDRKSFAGVYTKSFWTMGNERLQFNYLDSVVAMGMHLDDKDSRGLQSLLQRKLKK